MHLTCITHDLLITKFGAFGFDKKSIAFISANFKNRKHKTKVGSAFSAFLNIFSGVPQRLILFYINDNLDYASYAENKNFDRRFNFAEAIDILKRDIQKTFAWFKQNGFIANSGKSSSWSAELLGIVIDSDLTFHEHITKLFSQGNQKTNALTKVSNYMSEDKRIVIMNSYFITI